MINIHRHVRIHLEWDGTREDLQKFCEEYLEIEHREFSETLLWEMSNLFLDEVTYMMDLDQNDQREVENQHGTIRIKYGTVNSLTTI